MPLSFNSLIQYLIIAIVAYVLLGAPILQILGINNNTTTSRRSSTSLTPIHETNTATLPNIIIPSPNLTCPAHTYTTHILSSHPLLIYIESFLSPSDITHLTTLPSTLYHPSTTYSSPTNTTLDPRIRHSLKARPPRSPTIRCLEARASQFQGPRAYVFPERIWIQKYVRDGHYAHHYDWGAVSRERGRVSSFMAWVGDECEGGGTNFPRVRMPVGSRAREEWCRFVECGEEDGGSKEDADGDDAVGGVTFKPIKGNAVYWENFDVDTGLPFEESWHAGLPVTKGTKIGLNIWSWYQRGYAPSVADQEAFLIAQEEAENSVAGEKAEV